MVFVSALIPKAMSSLLTSTLLELAKPENAQWREACRSDDYKLDDVILEVQRLYPPFMGGRRVCTEVKYDVTSVICSPVRLYNAM